MTPSSDEVQLESMFRFVFSILPHLFVVQLIAGCALPVSQGLLDGPRALARLHAEPWAFGKHAGHKVRSAHYVLLTTIDDPEVVGASGRSWRGRITSIGRIAPDAPQTNRPMECYLFQYRDEWKRFTQEHTGDRRADLSPDQPRRVHRSATSTSRSSSAICRRIRVAAHEGWHQYVARHFKHRPPPFLEEGLACLFEQVKWEGGLPRWDLSSNANRIGGLAQRGGDAVADAAAQADLDACRAGGGSDFASGGGVLRRRTGRSRGSSGTRRTAGTARPCSDCWPTRRRARFTGWHHPQARQHRMGSEVGRRRCWSGISRCLCRRSSGAYRAYIRKITAEWRSRGGLGFSDAASEIPFRGSGPGCRVSLHGATRGGRASCQRVCAEPGRRAG